MEPSERALDFPIPPQEILQRRVLICQVDPPSPGPVVLVINQSDRWSTEANRVDGLGFEFAVLRGLG